MSTSTPMSTSTRRAALALAAAATTLVTLTACGGTAETGTEQVAEEATGTEQVAEEATGGDVAIDDEGITMTDDQGNQMAMGEGVAVPDNWPSNVPLFDGTLVMVSSNADGTATAAWTTEGDPTAVADAYGAQLESAGYSKQADANLDGTIVREYTSADLVISLLAGEADGVTGLTMTAMPAN